MSNGARAWYERGVARHYAEHGSDYRNPHDEIVARLIGQALNRWKPGLARVLDLAAGSGEASEPLIRAGANVEAIDPFTGEAYRRRIGRDCEAMTFEQIACGSLEDRSFDLVVCSFALHLCPPSRLASLAMALGRVTDEAWVISPHKRPAIDPRWGWRVADQFTLDRVHARRVAWSRE